MRWRRTARRGPPAIWTCGRAEALVCNLRGFARFLPIAALFNAQTINVAAIARAAGVARTTVEGYLDILEDTLLTFRLPAFEARLRVRERKLPKLYWVDAGVVRAVKRQLGEVAAEERGRCSRAGWSPRCARTRKRGNSTMASSIGRPTNPPLRWTSCCNVAASSWLLK